MESAHRNKLSSKFREHLRDKRVVCLDIPDDFDYMDPELVRLLKARIPRSLPYLWQCSRNAATVLDLENESIARVIVN